MSNNTSLSASLSRALKKYPFLSLSYCFFKHKHETRFLFPPLKITAFGARVKNPELPSLPSAHLRRQSVSDGGVHGIGRSSGAHKAVRVAREGVAPGGQAVRRAAFGLGACSRGLVARGGREGLGPVHRAGGLRHCRGQRADQARDLGNLHQFKDLTPGQDFLFFSDFFCRLLNF